jgi:N-acetylglucosaminyldiphosphoundecaprenol N-acetyl-beta-D-mannosaminyltransferase
MLILGVRFDTENLANIKKKIGVFLKKNKSAYIVTPNPEIVLLAAKNEELFFHLKKADISIADGFGIKLASFFCGFKIPRITGADLMMSLFYLSIEKKYRVAIVMWKKGLSSEKEVREAVQKCYPQLDFEIFACDKILDKKDYAKIFDYRPNISFIGLGAPYQEKVAYNLKNVYKLNSVNLVVGGSYDYLTGVLKRAPLILRYLGLEWMWRWLKQPIKRTKRIFNAVVVFFLKFLLWKYVLPFFYRPNVVNILYKKDKGKYYVLLLKRNTKQEHWQLPQGGTEYRSLKTAAWHEISEELGTTDFIIKKTIRSLYKYKYSTAYAFNIQDDNAARHSGYKGQKQGVAIAEFTGMDKDIKIEYWNHLDWQWVLKDEVVKRVYHTRQESAAIFIDKFNQYLNEKN